MINFKTAAFLISSLFIFFIVGSNNTSACNSITEHRYDIMLPAQTDFTGGFGSIKDYKNLDVWNNFTKENGDWSVLLNKYTGTIHRAFGKPIQIKGYSKIDKDNIEKAAMAFINEFAQILQVNTDNLKLKRITNVEKKWYVSYTQVFEGLEVLLSEIELRIFENGNVFAFGSTFYSDINVSTKPTISAARAGDLAADGMKINSNSDKILSTGKTYILPIAQANSIQYHLVYEANINTEEPAGRYLTYVDAHTGVVLWRQNKICNAMTEIKVSGEIKGRSPLDDPKIDNFEDLYVIFGKDTLTTDANGTINYNLNEEKQATVTLQGPWARVIINDAGMGKNGYTGTFKPGEKHTIEWKDNNSHKFERILFYHTNKVHNWIKEVDPIFTGMDYQVKVNLRFQGNSPNAYWDGESITFISLSVDEYRMAEGPAVVYHEYGHGINQTIYQQLGAVNGMMNASCNEGMADLNSSMILDEPEMGLGVFKSDPAKFIRTLKNNLVYPDSVVGESHHDGQILGGAYWDLREMTSLDYVKKLSHFAKYGLPDDANVGVAFSEWFLETLIADDDDGDLSNGTPYADIIIKAFNNHNIGTWLYSMSAFAHEPLEDTHEYSKPYKAEFTYTPIAINGNVSDSIYVVFTFDNFKTREKAKAQLISSGRYFAEIPAQAAGTVVKYYFTAYDPYSKKDAILSGDLLKFKPFSFLVGYWRNLYEDFETDKAKFIVGDLGDNATRGIFERAKPNQIDLAAYGSDLVIQTGKNHSPHGQICYVTGAGGNITNYMQNSPNGKTTLISDAYDLTIIRRPVIRFWNWMFNRPLFIAQLVGLFSVDGSSDGGASWVPIHSSEESTNDWEKFEFLVEDYLDISNNTKFKFIVQVPTGGGTAYSLTEVLIDDFEILSIDNIPLSIENTEEQTAALSIYPNPMSDIGYLTLNGETENVSLYIIDIYGSRLMTITESERLSNSDILRLNVSELAQGLYYIVGRIGGKSVHLPLTIVK